MMNDMERERRKMRTKGRGRGSGKGDEDSPVRRKVMETERHTYSHTYKGSNRENIKVQHNPSTQFTLT